MTDGLLGNLIFLLTLIVGLNITLLTVVVLGIRNIKKIILDCHSKTYCNLEDNITDSKSAVLNAMTSSNTSTKKEIDIIFNKLFEMSVWLENAEKVFSNNILLSSARQAQNKNAVVEKDNDVSTETMDNVEILMEISSGTNWDEIKNETNLKALFRKNSPYFQDYKYLEELLFMNRKHADLAVLDMFTIRTENCLSNMYVHNLYELLLKSPEDVIKTRLVGRKSFKEINKKLQSYGCHLGMNNREIFEAFSHYFN